MIDMFRIITNDLPFFGMSYHIDNTPVRKGLVGPGPRWHENTWNIHEWEWKGAAPGAEISDVEVTPGSARSLHFSC